MNTEPTEEKLTVDQEKEQALVLAQTAMASITNVPEYKETLTALVAKHKDAKFTDLSDKEGIKSVQAAYSETRAARLAIDKLGKNFKSLMKQIIEHGDGQIGELLEIVSPEEKRFKAEKDRVDELKQEAEDARLLAEEIQKQARIAKLVELGLKFNGAYWELGELSLTSLQVTQYSEAQFEGFVAQAKVVYEAEQLRIAEEAEAETKRIADEKAANLLLQQQNEAKQKLLDEAAANQKKQDDLIAQLQAQLKAQEAVKNAIPPEEPVTINPIKGMMGPFGGIPQPSIPLAPIKPLNGHEYRSKEELEAILDETFGPAAVMEAVKEAVKQDENVNHEVRLVFNSDKPYIDCAMGKATLRVYVEQFLEEASHGLQTEEKTEPNHVKTSGSIGDELLFIVFQ